jgi:hypothetical protein
LTDSIQRAEREILKYLLANQNARDTLEGIEKWWLPPSPGYGMADIAAALLHLEQPDLIRVWQSASAQPIYGRDSSDNGSIVEYLRTLE